MGQRPNSLPKNPPAELDASELHAQRWEAGTPAITWSTCWPQPAHVVFEH
ncbi:MAG: hypothetical protein ACXWDI_02905 [Nocardioides sp.]